MKKGTKIFVGVAVIALFILLGVLATHRHELRQAIQTVAIEMRNTSFSWIIMLALLIITSIPPMVGFTFTATLTGFIYGIPFGFPVAITGAFTGSMICCHLIRKYNFARYIRLSSSKQDKYHAIQDAIEQGGLRIMLMIRLSPIPWPITNMLLSLLPTVTLRKYTLTAFLSSFKLCLEVWVGSQLADISNPDLPPSAHRVAVFTMLGSVVILIIVAWWLYHLTMKSVKSISNRKKHDLPPYKSRQQPAAATITPSSSSFPYRDECIVNVDDEEKSVVTLALPTQNASIIKTE